MTELAFSFKKKGCAGEFYSDKDKILIYLHNIYNIYDLYNTIEHEYLHVAMDKLKIPIRKEHKLINAMNWLDFYIR